MGITYYSVYKNSTGNVGVGTISPTVPLDVQCDTGGTGIKLRGRSDNSTALRFYANNATTQQAYIGADDSNIDFLSVATRPIRFFVNSLIQYQINQLGVFSWYDGAGGTRMTLNSTGLGIGTTSPNTPLDVVSTSGANALQIRNRSNNDYGFIIFNNYAGSETSIAQIGAYRTGVNQGSLLLYTGTTEKVRINNDGNVGIGTTSPTYKLDVRGNVLIGDNTTNTVRIGSYSSESFIFSTSAIPLTFYVNGSEKMRIASDGNVGIGTTSPASKLSIVGSAAATNFKSLILRNGDGTVGSAVSIDFETSAGTIGDEASMAARISGIRLGSGTAGGLVFATTDGGNLGERVRILNNGAVGIGTTSPSLISGYVGLNVVNAGYTQIKLQSSASSAGIEFKPSSGNSWELQANNSNQWFVYDRTQSVYRLIIDVNGNVGIGTTSPNAALDVNGSIHLNGNIRNVWGDNLFNVTQYPSNSSTSPDYYMGFQTEASTRIFYINNRNNDGSATDPNGGIIFRTGGTPTNRMLISYTGNVGIGTTSPGVKLQTYATNTGAQFLMSGADGVNSLNFGLGFSVNSQTFATIAGYYTNSGGSGAGDITFYTKTISTALSEKMRIQADGNVGIGTTSPTHKLDIRGDVVIKGDSTQHSVLRFRRSDVSAYDFAYIGFENPALANDAFLISSAGNGNPLKLQAGASDEITFFGNTVEYARFNGNGNLGIGTISPANKLEVVSATANNGSPFAGCFFSGDDSSASWRCAVNLQHNANTTIAIGSSVGLSFAPLSSTSSNFYGSAAIKAVRPNTTANNQDTDLAFWTRTGASNNTVDTEKLRITGTGNVGIGTSSPVSSLHVAGTTSIMPTYDSGSQYSYFLRMGYDTSGNYDYTIKRSGFTGYLEFNGTQGAQYVSYVFAGGDVYSGSSATSVGAFYLNSTSHGIRRVINTNDVYCYTSSGTLYLGASGSSTTHIRVLTGGDVGIGVSPSYKLDVNGNIHATGFPTSSDVRFKKNITPLENSLEKIKKLQGVRYEWNEFINNTRDGYKLNVPIIGLIAQEVEKVVPEIVDLWKLSDECQDARSIDYPRLIPVLIEAIKEQQIIIENQNQKIENLIARMSALETK